MRIRQIKPSWWLDKVLRTSVTADVRELYIGLWMLADDAGWLVWDVSRIAAELYPYSSVARRERHVGEWSTRLAALDGYEPHLIIEKCGHARVPKLVDHQHFGGRPVYTVRDAHARDCARADADARPGRVGNGRVGKGIAGFKNPLTPDDLHALRDEEDEALAARLRGRAR